MRKEGRGDEHDTTMHLFKIQIFTHDSHVIKFSLYELCTYRQLFETPEPLRLVQYILLFAKISNTTSVGKNMKFNQVCGRVMLLPSPFFSHYALLTYKIHLNKSNYNEEVE